MNILPCLSTTQRGARVHVYEHAEPPKAKLTYPSCGRSLHNKTWFAEAITEAAVEVVIAKLKVKVY